MSTHLMLCICLAIVLSIVFKNNLKDLFKNLNTFKTALKLLNG